ncbi:GNAT family N-acetyltransferase [Leifsonia sp. YIM 134122]|uniref:GNAT family N-acetyltransferase n=1 Tax=Leifsonia stereocauli TaxID=3134136 RepID=A0ABU9W4D4_9MICO
MPILTARLILEPYTVDIAERLLAGVPAASDLWADGYPFADELDVARLYLRISAEHGDPAPFGPYVVRLRATGEAIGGLGFFGPPDAAADGTGEDATLDADGGDTPGGTLGGTVEFGYGLIPGARGAGLATEAVIAALHMAAALGALVARADTTPDNIASQRVMVKAGMTEVARSAASVVYERRLQAHEE